jgi:hypothetical protein
MNSSENVNARIQHGIGVLRSGDTILGVLSERRGDARILLRAHHDDGMESVRSDDSVDV